MTPRQIQKTLIQLADKKVGTRGERQFKAYAESRVMNLKQDVSINFFDISGNKFTFQLDFVDARHISDDICPGCIKVDYEVDGLGHKTKWDAWKDEIKSQSHVKVIHIPEAVTVEKWWSYLDVQLGEALRSEEMIHYIAA